MMLVLLEIAGLALGVGFVTRFPRGSADGIARANLPKRAGRLRRAIASPVRRVIAVVPFGVPETRTGRSRPGSVPSADHPETTAGVRVQDLRSARA